MAIMSARAPPRLVVCRPCPRYRIVTIIVVTKVTISRARAQKMARIMVMKMILWLS